MSNKKVLLTADVNTGLTEFAIQFLRNFRLSELDEIVITPAENDRVIVSFFIKQSYNSYYKLNVKNAFCVGMRNERSCGLHDVMIDAGFDEYDASRVFSSSCHKITVFKKN